MHKLTSKKLTVKATIQLQFSVSSHDYWVVASVNFNLRLATSFVGLFKPFLTLWNCLWSQHWHVGSYSAASTCQLSLFLSALLSKLLSLSYNPIPRLINDFLICAGIGLLRLLPMLSKIVWFGVRFVPLFGVLSSCTGSQSPYKRPNNAQQLTNDS